MRQALGMHEYLRGDDSEIDHIQVEMWSFFFMETTNGYKQKRGQGIC
jgi:hypothetical protein